MMKKLLPNYCSLLDKNVVKTSIFKMLLITLVILFGSIASVRSQTVAGDYTYVMPETSPATYVDINTGAQTSLISGTFTNVPNLTTPTNIGFGFVFNNVNYTQVIISDNGFISFGTTGPGLPTMVAPISGATTPCVSALSNSFRGLFDVSSAINSEVSYLTSGVAGAQVFTVQYKNLHRTTGTGTLRGRMSFQIKLYETTNKIEIIFEGPIIGGDTGISNQMGIRASATDFKNRINGAGSTFYPTAAGSLVGDTFVTNPTTPIGPPAGGMVQTWAPGCINPTLPTISLQGDLTSANLLWTAPLHTDPGFVNYIWELRQGAMVVDSGTTTATTVFTTVLSLGSPYTLYVRSNCKATWAVSPTVTPSCTALGIPYTQNFETAVVPGMPTCNNVVPVGLSAPMVTVDNSVTAYYGFNNKNVKTGDVAAANTWYFTPGLLVTPGNTYRLTYKYGGSRELAQFTQKMKVAIGLASAATPTVAMMTLTIADHPSIKASPITYTLNFTVPGSGAPVAYYIGFNGYAAANQGYLQLDDISVTSPTCFPPTALTSGQVTSNSAIISWTSPVSAPAAGYEYYYGPTATTTAPIATTVVMGSTPAGGVVANLSTLTPSTPYSFWVRSNCGGEASVWSLVGTFTTLASPPTPCTPAPSSVDGSGITNVNVGTINNTTGAETGNYGNYTTLSTNIAKTSTVTVKVTYSTGWTYNTKIWIDWNNDGTFDDDQENVATGVSTAVNPTTLTLTFVVPSSTLAIADTAGAHRMRIGGADADLLTGYAAGQGPCYTGIDGSFEDYMVYVTVAPPALTVLDANNSTTTTVCSGVTSPRVMVNTGASSFTVYTWSPSGGVSGDLATGYYFTPTTSTNYTLTATQASAPYSTNTATYTVIVNALPTPVVFTPAAVTVCQGIPQTLTTSGGIVSGTTVLEENFNSATNGFTTTVNMAGGGSVGPAAGAWTLRPSPYQAPPPTGGTNIFSSNDSSQFYLTNSDAQGTGGTTNTELISPDFNISGYTDAFLSFYHHYRDLGGTGEVQIANDTDAVAGNGEVYTTIPGYAYNSDQGAVNNFVNVVINLSPYITGGTKLRIKFKYINATFAWWWAIDNFKITGSAPSNLTWSPATGLYTNIACAPGDAYVLGTPVPTVYVKLDNNQTYTATATSTVAPYCSTSTNVAVTVTKLNATAIGDQTISCGGVVTQIELQTYEPTNPLAILRWESAFNPAFTGAITVPGSANQVILTPLLIGTVGSTTYYRAVVSGCNTVYSNTVTITVNSTTWDSPAFPLAWSNGTPDINTAVIIDGNLTISADMAACSLQIISGNVIVNPGVTLTVQNALNVISGTLQFDSSILSGSASLVQGASTTVNTNTGNIIYKRHSTPVRLYDYTYWSSPVATQTLTQSAAGLFVDAINNPLPMQSDKYYWFKNRTGPSVYAWTAPTSTTMDVGLGYIIRAPLTSHLTNPAEITATFRGKPNNGNVPITIYKYGANDLNCIGNPYPSAISANAFVTQNAAAFTNGAVLGTTFYFWTHNSQISGGVYDFDDYAVYNSTGATGTGDPILNPGVNMLPATGKIAAGQSFMVRGIVDGATPAMFTNSMRLSAPGDNNHFYRSGQTEFSDRHRVWLDLRGPQGAYKQILVGYVPNAANAYDNGFDGEILEAGNPISLYSIIDDKKLTIQGRALPFELTDQVPLGFMSPTSGNFSITLSNTDGMFADNSNILVYLEDRLLNTIHNLSESPYTFVSDEGTYDTRFVLRYSDQLAVTQTPMLSENAVIAYKQNGSIHVKTSNIVMKSVKVFDARGRLVLMQDDINSAATVFANAAISNQMLIVQVTSVDGVTINKKIIF